MTYTTVPSLMKPTLTAGTLGGLLADVVSVA